MLHRITVVALSTACCVLSAAASAWKLETHILQARTIWSEIESDNGSVRITPEELQPVPSYVRNALRDHRNVFTIAVLGADLYPDMVGGQLTMHPGLGPRDVPPDAVNGVLRVLGRPIRVDKSWKDRAWKTDQWIKHVLDAAHGGSNAPQRATAEAAFAYGYLLHAAMDMWAHTYVNTYTGGVFELTTNQETAARHIALETYIKGKHPSILTLPPLMTSAEARSSLGAVANQIAAQPHRLLAGVQPPPAGPSWFNEMRAPTEFVRRTLILNADAADQYVRTPATLHLWAMYTYWSEIDRAGRDFGGVQTAIQNAIAEAGRAVDSADSAWRTAQSAYNAAVRAADDAYDTFRNAERNAQKRADALGEVTQAIIDLVGKKLKLEDAIENAPKPLRDAYNEAKRLASEAQEAVEAARRTRDRAIADRDAKQREMDAALRELNLRKETRQAFENATRIRVPLVNEAIREWRAAVERAVDEYIRAWEDTAKETMRPKGNRFQSGSDPTMPLKQWVTCYGPTFGLPVPGALPAACRDAMNQYERAKKQLEELLVAAVIPEVVRREIVKYDESIKKVGGELLVEVAKLMSNVFQIGPNGELGGLARTVVIQLDKDTPDDSALNDEYDDNISSENWLVVFRNPMVAELIRKDLSASPGTIANPLPGLEKFAALQNSMTMSRLALLDGAGLNAVIRRRIDSLLPGAVLPGYGDSEPVGALMLGAVSSIDGDHQWQSQAPPLPSMSPPDPPLALVAGRQFSYPIDRTIGTGMQSEREVRAGRGMLLWRDARLRQCVWDQIMHGPLTPGLVERYGALTKNFAARNSYPAVGTPQGTQGCKRPTIQNPNLQTPLTPMLPTQ